MLLNFVTDFRSETHFLEILGRHFQQLVQVGNVLVNR